MKYLALLGAIVIVFYVVYTIFVLIDIKTERKPKRKPKSIGYENTWNSVTHERKIEPEFETVEKLDNE